MIPTSKQGHVAPMASGLAYLFVGYFGRDPLVLVFAQPSVGIVLRLNRSGYQRVIVRGYLLYDRFD